MYEKKADNIILTKKQIINQIDDKLSEEKKNIKNLENIQNNYHSLNKNMSKCISLLSKSIKGPQVDSMLSEFEYNNKRFMIKTDEKIEKELKEIKKRVNKLYLEKEETIKRKKDK